jgi:hypothetical protein
MAEDLIQTPNGTFVTRAEAEAAGLEVPKAKRKAATTAKRKPATRKAAGATRKGK